MDSPSADPIRAAQDVEVRRNRLAAENIAAGQSPLTDDILTLIRRNIAAHLDVPGPRVGQILADLDAARASLASCDGQVERLQDLSYARLQKIRKQRAAIERVRELHHEVDEHGDDADTWCAVCLSGEWPCETIRALEDR